MKVLILLISLLFGCSQSDDPIQYGYNEQAGEYFEVSEDTRLYYEIYGEGPAILLLHGGVFGYIDEYEELIPVLAEKHRVICLATRGHVKSDIGTEPYSYEQRASDAYQLLQHLNVSSVTVIGFSDGGFTAYKMAAIYPDLVEKVVAIGAGDDPPKDSPGNSNYNAEDLLSEYGDYFQKRVDNMPEPERWNESLEMLNELYNSSFVSKETFQRIKCPVLVMGGDRDEYSTPEEFLAVHKHLQDSQLAIIPGCSHVVFFCNFPAVWESMKIFLGYQ
jgi:pimeloyl-ACP methyl ester carboxylesterase